MVDVYLPDLLQYFSDSALLFGEKKSTRAGILGAYDKVEINHAKDIVISRSTARCSLSGKPAVDRGIEASPVLFALIGFLSRSFGILDGDEIGGLKRFYLAGELPPGRIIALDGQRGFPAFAGAGRSTKQSAEIASPSWRRR